MGELVGEQNAREVKRRVLKYGQTDVWLGRYDSGDPGTVSRLDDTTSELLKWFGVSDNWAARFTIIQFINHYENDVPSEGNDLSGYPSIGQALFDLAMNGLPFEESDGGHGGCRLIAPEVDGYHIQLSGEGQCWDDGAEPDPETEFSLTFSAQIMTMQAASRVCRPNF